MAGTKPVTDASCLARMLPATSEGIDDATKIEIDF